MTKLNTVEKLTMNNPVRALLQRRYEAGILERLGGRLDRGARALEIGCGRGVGVGIVIDRFGAERVDGFDLDPDMIGRARRWFDADPRVRLWVGDATRIEAADGAYDAVFDFGIVHHVPDWRAALAEVRRVLRPGGRFYFEEVTKHALDRWTYRTLFEHPEHDRFTARELLAELEHQGLQAGERHVERFFGDFVIGVATRTEEHQH
ncbi:MAG: class I SAM-dependent methyltransferase [Acidimicrobiia bacterium]